MSSRDHTPRTTLSPAQQARLEARLRGEAPAAAIPRRAPDAPLALSSAQRSVWLIDGIMGGLSNPIQIVLRLRGALDRHALDGALTAMVERHDALRTLVAATDGVARPVLLPPGPVAAVGATLPPGGIPAATSAEAERGFDLARGPLLRAVLHSLGHDDRLLILTIHHIAADGWSQALLVDELLTTYEALAAGRRPPLEPPTIGYADYASWEQEALAGPEIAERLAEVCAQLEGAPELTLPNDHPRPPRPGFAGAVHERALPADLLVRARGFAKDHGSTLYATVLTALIAVLERHTGQRDLVVGTPVANRGQVELESLVGCIAHVAALRVAVARDASFATLHAGVRAALADALAHQQVPFELVQERLRGAVGARMLNVVFQVDDWRGAPRHAGGLTCERVRDVTWGRPTQDLRVVLHELDTGPRLCLVYDAALFDPPTIERFAGHIEVLLAAALARPDGPLAHLPLLTDPEVRRLDAWGQREAPPPGEESLHGLFLAQAARAPDAIALLNDTEELSYAELRARAARLARQLRGHGVGPEARVGLFLRRSARAVEAMLAVLQAGAAWVPLDPDHPAPRLALLAREARLRLVLTEEALAARLPAVDAPVLSIERLAAEGPTAAPGDLPPVHPDQPAYLIYTSGSTGTPKGVVITHRGVASALRAIIERFALQAGDRFSAIASFNFDLSAFEIFGALAAGASVALVSSGGRDVAAVARTLRERRCTVLSAVPSLVAALLDQGHGADLAPQTLRTLVIGGEAMPITLPQRLRSLLPDARIWNVGGATECSQFQVAFGIGAPDPSWTSVPYGHALPGHALRVLDDRYRPVAVGVSGELFIAGDGVGRGYHLRPDLTAERFVPDPFGAPGARMFRTGDRVRWRPDGELEFLGRLDRQIKLRGMRIEIGEIEAALATAGASEAVVVQRDRRLVAYAVAGPQADPAVLLGRLRNILPAPYVPSQVVLLPALPRSPNGKVDLGALPSPPAPGDAGAAHGPDGAEEALIAAIWTDLLHVEVGSTDDFVALGGDSLQATGAMGRLSAEVGRELPISLILEHTTPARLAAAVRALPGAAPLPPLVRNAEPKGRLSFSEQRFWLLEQLERRAAYHLYTWIAVPPAVRDLEGVLEQLVARHPILRATYPVRDGEARREILPSWRPAPTEVAVPDDAALRDLLQRTLEPRFDLERGPLVRFQLVRRPTGERLLLCVLHHIVCDGSSLGVLEGDLSAGFAGGATPPGRPAVDYADFALWQRALADHPLVAAQRHAWGARLSPPPPRLALPRGPAPAAPAGPGVVAATRVWPDALSQRLRSLWRAHGATPFTGVLAAWCALLARYTGSEDLLLGMPEAGRRYPGLDRVIGCFVNTLPLRLSAAGDPTFLQLLRRAGEATRFALAHADVPFELLSEGLQRGADRRAIDLFIVGADLEGGPPSASQLHRRLGIEEVSKADATLYVAARSGPVRTELIYDGRLFEAEAIDQHADDLQRIAVAVSEDPTLPLSALPIGDQP